MKQILSWVTIRCMQIPWKRKLHCIHRQSGLQDSMVIVPVKTNWRNVIAVRNARMGRGIWLGRRSWTSVRLCVRSGSCVHFLPSIIGRYGKTVEFTMALQTNWTYNGFEQLYLQTPDGSDLFALKPYPLLSSCSMWLQDHYLKKNLVCSPYHEHILVKQPEALMSLTFPPSRLQATDFC